LEHYCHRAEKEIKWFQESAHGVGRFENLKTTDAAMQIFGFGVNEDITQEQLRRVFRQIIRKAHPDHNQSTEQSNQMSSTIIEAYKFLSDELEKNSTQKQ